MTALPERARQPLDLEAYSWTVFSRSIHLPITQGLFLMEIIKIY